MCRATIRQQHLRRIALSCRLAMIRARFQTNLCSTSMFHFPFRTRCNCSNAHSKLCGAHHREYTACNRTTSGWTHTHGGLCHAGIIVASYLCFSYCEHDVQDSNGQWLHATVIGVAVHVAFNGWSSEWNEWIRLSEDRVWPLELEAHMIDVVAESQQATLKRFLNGIWNWWCAAHSATTTRC